MELRLNFEGMILKTKQSNDKLEKYYAYASQKL